MQHANFSANFSASAICEGAIDFAVLRMRGWRRGAECRTFFGVAGFAPKPNF